MVQVWSNMVHNGPDFEVIAIISSCLFFIMILYEYSNELNLKEKIFIQKLYLKAVQN